jgi:hypothetical protein
MGWTQTLKEEWPKTLLQVSLSALGFLIALAINSGLANLNERASYNSMLTSIRAEADLNETILTNSFEKYYENGLVLRRQGKVIIILRQPD